MEQHFYLAKGKMFGIFVLMVLLLLLSTALIGSMLFIDEELAIGTFTILVLIFLLFAWCTIFIGKKLVNSEPAVTVSPHGLTIYMSEPIDIKWSDIEGFVPYVYQRNRFLGVVLTNENEYIDNLQPTGRRLAKLNQKLNFPAFNVSMNLLKEEEAFLEALGKNNAIFFMEE